MCRTGTRGTASRRAETEDTRRHRVSGFSYSYGCSAFMYPPLFRGKPEAISNNIFIQITPCRIVLLDQFEFPYPPPVFDALLSHNRAPHRFVALIPNQRVNTVTLRETFRRTVLMLPDPTEKVGRNADIERSATLIGENVDARLLHCSADSHCFRLLITDAAISVLCSHRHCFHRHSGESRNPS